MKAFRKASQVVSSLARKYECNKVWIWELLDAHFNMQYGEAAVMSLGEIEELKDIIEELLDE